MPSNRLSDHAEAGRLSILDQVGVYGLPYASVHIHKYALYVVNRQGHTPYKYIFFRICPVTLYMLKTIREIIAANVTWARELSRMTQGELATKAGISPRSVQRAEDPAVEGMEVATLDAIARALGTTPAHLCASSPTDLAGPPELAEILALVRGADESELPKILAVVQALVTPISADHLRKTRA